jgi:membrane protein implicated in regulation of membrane protease activity
MGHTVLIIIAAFVAVVLALFVVKIMMGVALLTIWLAIVAVKLAFFIVIAVIIFTIIYRFFRRRMRSS